MRRPGVRWTVARLAALLARLKRHPTLGELKRRYGVGVRDLYRLNARVLGTVDETAVSTGSAVLSVQIAGEVAFSMAGPLLEKAASLSRAEHHLAVTGLRWLAVPGPLRQAVADLARKVAGVPTPPGGRHEVVFAPTLTRREEDNLLCFREACREGRKVRFRYEGDAADFARVVRPLSLRKDAGAWRLLAWDEARGGLRVFRLVHVSEARALDEPFEWPQGLDREEALARDLSVYRPSGRETRVQLKIRAGALRRLQHLFPLHRAPRTGNAWMRAELLSSSPAWVARTLLPESPDVKVLSPADFAQALKEEHRAVLQKYL
jgi:predicted DNA-binding transcriptional regulator YafY